MLTNFAPYVAPLLVFGLVVFVHELGHFLAAKLTGVYAPVFSLGWGRRLFGVRHGETDYRVSMFPIGGYVRMATREDDSMAGIEGGIESSDMASPAPERRAPSALWDAASMAPFGPKAVPEDRWVESKSLGARILILSAGVIMNVVLALTVSSGVFYLYGNPYRPAVIDSVVTGAPAAQAGLVAGDVIVAVGGTPVHSWDEVVDRIAPVTSGTLQVDVMRGRDRRSYTVSPQPSEGTDPVTGAKRTVGKVGIQVKDSLARDPVGLVDAVSSGGRATWYMASSVVKVLGGLVTGQVSAKNLGGPIAIAKTSVQAARNGAEMLWSLIAFLSINIAILNLVPIPVLDGGQILLVVLERIKGRAFSAGTREMFARVGVLAVLALILLVTFNDARSFFTK